MHYPLPSFNDCNMTQCTHQDKASRKDKSGDMISSQDNVFGYMETGTSRLWTSLLKEIIVTIFSELKQMVNIERFLTLRHPFQPCDLTHS
jgi:hypothetical protein